MAESFPSTIAANILTKMDFLAFAEIRLSSRVRKEITKAKQILCDVKDAVLNAEAQQAQNCKLQIGLEKLSELLYDAEDVLDELKCEVLAKQVSKLSAIIYYGKIKDIRKKLDEKAAAIRSIYDENKQEFRRVYSGEMGMNNSFLVRTSCGPSICKVFNLSRFLNPLLTHGHHFKYVRLLCLSGLQFEVLPDSVGALKHLTCLDLSWNLILKKLCAGICKLRSLQILRLLGCSRLKNFPNNMGKMIGLRYLEMTTTDRHLPQIGVECFSSLRYLHLYNFHHLESLSEVVQSLTSLRTLILKGCDSMNSLLDDIQHLKRLEKFVIYSCLTVNLQMGLQGKDFRLNLKVFIIYDLEGLEDLPQMILEGSANTLEYLRTDSCPKLTELPAWLVNLTALQKLEIVSCQGLSSLPDGILNLFNLSELMIQNCPTLSESLIK
ncbi:hypothetical protein Pint_11931 [Pistacia integerrima]|uniref:Uncharacterized protein n=1 Tax=Pistacia integerrima TaxID=434235 RepID=A0ACC0XJJ8_9ROSI|nr:hypothetical protein Pint_11931 [Pistacia integerrima]